MNGRLQRPLSRAGTKHRASALMAVIGEVAMQFFLGLILGALHLFCGVYVYDSMQTSSVANGQVAATNRTIVNWDVAHADWTALKHQAHQDWIRISSK